MWTAQPAAFEPVDNAVLSPVRANSYQRLPQRIRGIIPVVHTPYDYFKGIS
jgi:hypothetical protein